MPREPTPETRWTGLGIAPGIAVACDDPEIPADSGNLVWKAAAKFADHVVSVLKDELNKRAGETKASSEKK